MCQFARSKGAWRIVDEIYLNLHHGEVGLQPMSVLSFDDEALVINSFSKYFGMTGWRLGWCVVPERAVNDFGEYQGNQYVRLSYASAESELEEGLHRLAIFMERLNIALST
ncbi:MAG: aspartate/methionine/tyrosine aminotransferase [Paraglaciecola sp.]|jgi:aspartate/methionine/tyrosine aminotransferase